MPIADLTHITLVVDRSGSMESVRDDAIGGFNAFLDQQRAAPEKATAAGWHVLFLAADMEVAAAASRMGGPRTQVGTYERGGRGTRNAFGEASRIVTSIRTGIPPSPPDNDDPKKKPN